MVGIAQLVESRIVIPVVVGSSPISHPTILGVDHNLHWIKKRSLVLRFFISTHQIPPQTKKAAEAAFSVINLSLVLQITQSFDALLNRRMGCQQRAETATNTETLNATR